MGEVAELGIKLIEFVCPIIVEQVEQEEQEHKTTINAFEKLLQGKLRLPKAKTKR